MRIFIITTALFVILFNSSFSQEKLKEFLLSHYSLSPLSSNPSVEDYWNDIKGEYIIRLSNNYLEKSIDTLNLLFSYQKNEFRNLLHEEITDTTLPLDTLLNILLTVSNLESFIAILYDYNYDYANFSQYANDLRSLLQLNAMLVSIRDDFVSLDFSDLYFSDLAKSLDNFETKKLHRNLRETIETYQLAKDELEYPTLLEINQYEEGKCDHIKLDTLMNENKLPIVKNNIEEMVVWGDFLSAKRYFSKSDNNWLFSFSSVIFKLISPFDMNWYYLNYSTKTEKEKAYYSLSKINLGVSIPFFSSEIKSFSTTSNNKIIRMYAESKSYGFVRLYVGNVEIGKFSNEKPQWFTSEIEIGSDLTFVLGVFTIQGGLRYFNKDINYYAGLALNISTTFNKKGNITLNFE